MIDTFGYVVLLVPILIAVAPATIKKIILWFIKNIYKVHKFVFYGKYRYLLTANKLTSVSMNISKNYSKRIHLLSETDKILESITGVPWHYKTMAYKKIASALLEEKVYTPSKWSEILFIQIYASCILFIITSFFILCFTSGPTTVAWIAILMILVLINGIRTWVHDSKRGFQSDKKANPLEPADIFSNYIILYICSLVRIQEYDDLDVIKGYLEENRGGFSTLKPRISKGYSSEIQRIKEEYREKYKYFIPPIVSGVYLIPDLHRLDKSTNIILSTTEHIKKYISVSVIVRGLVTVICVVLYIILVAHKIFGIGLEYMNSLLSSLL